MQMGKWMLWYAFLMDGGAVLWNMKKQDIIALSMTEAEYVMMTHTAKEASGKRHFRNYIQLDLSHLIKSNQI